MTTTIFKATYSNVPVYEMPCKGVAVMRRRADAWLNATQILKVAGFDKPQRTRILEREVQKGTHEKVQGGYGKYQGTWVPSERGLALAQQYGVDHLLTPIIDYVPTEDSPPQAPKHITALPGRAPKRPKVDHDSESNRSFTNVRQTQRQSAAAARQAAAAQRQANAAAEQAASAAAAAIAAAASTPPPPQQSHRAYESQAAKMPPPSTAQSQSPSNASSNSRTPSPVESAHSEYDPDGEELRKRKRSGRDEYISAGSMLAPPPMRHAQHHGSAAIPPHMRSHTASQEHHMHISSNASQGPARYARMILDYFISESSQIPNFLMSPPPDFDANVIIDDDGHTALHWACAMGRIRIVRLLLTAGADIFRANAMGQTALMRSVMFTNNYDLRKFPELFELLHRSTINIDRNDRTVFHYVVDIALQKGKTHAARYYMETILSRLVDYPREVADILNFQDEEGETPLTLAARARSRRLVKLLLDYGADPKIANKEGKSAEDYILEDERFRAPEYPAVGALGQATAPMHAAPSKVYVSDTARHVATTVLPQVTQLMGTLASSFDTELETQTQNLAQANTLLSNIQTEIQESQQIIQLLKQQAGTFDQVKTREEELERELKEKMNRRFREGWERYMRDEQVNKSNALHSLYVVPDDQTVESACDEAIKTIETLATEKQQLFDKLVSVQADLGTSSRLDDYRKLLALGCGMPAGEVDSVIDGLLETLDEPAVLPVQS